MTKSTGREITWAGGTHTFDLGHPWVRRVIAWRGINGHAPHALLTRLGGEIYSSEDVERVIELGLIGGGMTERDVEALLDAHVRDKPLNHSAPVASTVLAMLIVGADNASA
ncbi:gene transfer agent family protein [Bradyrhizobium sp. CB2312]|uniref:gene transfer agent family protein n=1 Tax=Bradyrhizobium sp. CB2312 TaxID=3039155 RepID=UPI0024B14571|nr:gene transfer agent family protein [Bradyrhizobium sp. CB2312]WFU69437.1 gene transfer agent family protein [Bradyrhizobium sp. CB2312]